MEKTEKHITWKPKEVIYKAGDQPEGAYLIVAGCVYLYTAGGLKLNKLGVNEIFGDASLILKRKRSVTAVAGDHEVQALFLPWEVIEAFLKKNKVVGALIRKTNLRLLDSNAQSEDLAKDLENLTLMIKSENKISKNVTKLVANMRKKVNKTLEED
jgi:CRP-like cAMP-binding protein